MASENTKIDNNRQHTLAGVTDDVNAEIRNLLVDASTGRLKCSAVVTMTPTPAGSDTQVQFNDAASLAGDTGMTYNKTTDVLTLVGGVNAPKLTNLTTNGYVKTGNTDGTLSVETQINHTALSNIGTNTHSQIDTFIGTKAQASGLASLDGSSKVVQDPANATATATASKIPIADGSGKLDTWVSDASDTVKGKVELATIAETTTGTSTTLAVTPDGLAGSNYGKRVMQVKVFDDATAVTIGDGKLILCISSEFNGMNLVDADAYCTTVSSSGTPTVMIRNVTDSQDMLSTAITIDANEYTSYTAATAPVINTSYDDVATGDLIAIDVDGIGTGTKGLGVILSFQLP